MIGKALTGLAVLAVLASHAAFSQTPKYPFQDPTIPAEKRIDNILSLMTVDEKIDMLGTQTGVARLGIVGFGGSEGIHGLQQRGGENRHTKPIPTTQFPQPPGMGDTWDPELVKQAAGVQGYEARFVSQTPEFNRHALMSWGPQADLARDPRWGRGEEVYGEDAFLNGTMVTAFVKGLQGDDPKYWQSAALLKHFLANSNENGRGNSSSNFDQRLFWEYYSLPFRMGFLEGGAKGVMASYNSWNGTPMGVNPILKSILIDKWGLEVISSDGGAVKNLVTLYKRYPTQEAAVVACLKAGINQFLDQYKDETKAALKDGLITEPELDELIRRKFRISIKLGLLDPPEMVPYTAIKGSPEPWNTDKNRDISKKMALESVVLLKNKADFLPLDRQKIKSIAVIGSLANGVHWDWYGGLPPYTVTPLEGIQKIAGSDIAVHFVEDNTDNKAVDAAKNSDIAVVVVGNDPTCGPNMAHEWISDGTAPCHVNSDGREGRDRESINLAQEDLVKQVYAANPKTVMILVSSFPFAINWSNENLPAILHMTHSSQDEGTALASVLFGDYNPGGHLVETWPTSADQLPPMMDYDIRKGRTYMYFKSAPLYPFGFGLSYTTFRYSKIKATKSPWTEENDLTVSVDVTNTGTRTGDTVVQLYARYQKSRVPRPLKQLVGFKRVTVAPHSTVTVQIPVKAMRLEYWDDTAQHPAIEAGKVQLLAGTSSADLPLSTTISLR